MHHMTTSTPVFTFQNSRAYVSFRHALRLPKSMQVCHLQTGSKFFRGYTLFHISVRRTGEDTYVTFLTHFSVEKKKTDRGRGCQKTSKCCKRSL